MEKGQQVRVMDFRGTYKGGGGPDKTILNSAAMHDKGKLFVLVTYLRDPDDYEFQIEQRASEMDLNYVDIFDRKLFDFCCIEQLIELARKHEINVIHAHDDKTSMYAFFIRRRLPAVKVIYTCHLYSEYKKADFSSYIDYLKFRVRKYARFFFLSKSDRPILAVSHSAKEALVRDGINAEQIHTVHNGIDTDKWRRDKGRPVLRRELSLPEDAVLIGTVARIAFQKDLPTFYTVARRVKEACPRAFFVIVGDGVGDEFARAQAGARQSGVAEFLRFTGHRNDLLDVYASFDIFLMTSISEGLPNTLLEAMAMENPVVSTAVDGVPEVVEDGVSGYLTVPGDATQLSAHVLRLIEDPELRQQCGKAGRRRIEESFCFSRRVRLMEDYYAWFAGCGVRPEPDC
jgi:glycosyltransferase involved in cell wall biosynthesis